MNAWRWGEGGGGTGDGGTGGRDALIEAAVAAHRETDREGRFMPPPAWWDLSPQDAEELFRRQVVTRELERATSPVAWSGTMAAVMRRIG